MPKRTPRGGGNPTLADPTEEFAALPMRPSDRDRENSLALGGMRNAIVSVSRVRGAAELGHAVRSLFASALRMHPQLRQPALDILSGREPEEYQEALIRDLRSAVLTLLGATDHQRHRQRTAKASTPLCAEVIEAWRNQAADPDSEILAQWLDHGAPLGFNEDIPTTGVFPEVPRVDHTSAGQNLSRSLQGWRNFASAVEEAADLKVLVADYCERGSCHLTTYDQACEELGAKPVLNKLGVIIKEKLDARGQQVRKARIIWDMRESGANHCCHQKERILLPRLLDAVHAVLQVYRSGSCPYLAAVDIRDAFMNIPAGADKVFSTAAIPTEHGMRIIVFDTLVFGSSSSPNHLGALCCVAWPYRGRRLRDQRPDFC